MEKYGRNTLAQRARISIKKISFIFAPIVFFILLFAATDWLLPGSLHNGLLIAGMSYVSELALLSGLGIFFYFGYKAISVIKKEKSPRRGLVKIMLATVLFFGAILFTLNFFAGRSITNCEKFNHNNKLNGGSKEFNGKKYTINICGNEINDNPFFGDGLETVQLTIIDDQGDEVAKRNYKIFWDAEPGHESLTVSENSITYQDDEDQRSYIINMPPTPVDWIQARIPIFSVWR